MISSRSRSWRLLWRSGQITLPIAVGTRHRPIDGHFVHVRRATADHVFKQKISNDRGGCLRSSQREISTKPLYQRNFKDSFWCPHMYVQQVLSVGASMTEELPYRVHRWNPIRFVHYLCRCIPTVGRGFLFVDYYSVHDLFEVKAWVRQVQQSSFALDSSLGGDCMFLTVFIHDRLSSIIEQL